MDNKNEAIQIGSLKLKYLSEQQVLDNLQNNGDAKFIHGSSDLMPGIYEGMY